MFPAGIHFSYGWGSESPTQVALRQLPREYKRRALWVLDEADAFPPEVRPEIGEILKVQPKLDLLMAGRHTFELADLNQANIQLRGLSEAEFRQVIARRLSGADKATVEKLWEKFEGNTSLAQFAGKSVREGLLSLSELASKLTNFERPGILGPDGKPVTTGSAKAKKIIAEVQEVNEELLRLIEADPKAIYSLSSRKFEEVVAEILARQGYHIELTPASKDGGFDMYAARKESLGEFLYLVECKRYSARRNVGVQIVRALHGVVQQKRATAGVIATTSYFTKGAQEFRQELAHQMQLADYVELQSWLLSAIKPQVKKAK